MMNDIQIFNNPEFGDIRTVMIDDEPWFVGRDVSSALGYKKPTNALYDNVDKDDTFTTGITDSMNRIQQMLVINESGIYSLIFNSKLESAKKFKKWVTSEVLPSIRKTGSYTYSKKLSALEQLQLQSQAILEVNDKIDAVQQELDDFKNDMPLLGVETDKITNAVKAKGVEVLGGKNSNAYNDNSLRTKVYQDIHREVRRQFGVSTYKSIKRNQCDKAVELINAYEPPMYLKEQIKNLNAQIRIA